jgi:hypothetical protein
VRRLTLAAGRDPLVVNAGTNGGVHVEGWDREDVLVLARIKARARSRDEAKALAGEIELLARGTRLSAQGPVSGDGRAWHVEYRVFVPRKTDLSLITRNGPLGVRNVSGTMDIRSENGPVSLEGLSGAVEARTHNGPLSVVLTGRRWVGAGLDAEAENGPVSIQIPRDYSARLETGTINGPTQLQYPIEWPGSRRHRIVTTLGSGGRPVRVVTTNGPFTLSSAR